MRRRGISGRDAIVIALILTAAAIALLAWPSGSSSTSATRGGNAFASARFGLSGTLPADWSRSPRRLVPLLMPREVLSVGTAPMPPGGGGNCDREPVAAIARLRHGDALVSVQEYAVTPRMRARMAETYPPLSAYSNASRLGLRRYATVHLNRTPASRVMSPAGPARGYWSATLPFRDHGRVFDALVYVKGAPSPTRLDEIVAILAGLEFRPDAAATRPKPGDA